MIQWIKSKLIKHYIQLGKYSVIGIFCFLLDISILIILTKFTRIHYLIASSIGYLTGVIVNYLFSITWVFSKRNLKKYWHVEFSIFMVIELFAMTIMSISLFGFRDYLGLNLKISKVLANFIAAIWNYAVKHIFLFKQHPEQKQQFLEERKSILQGNKIKRNE